MMIKRFIALAVLLAGPAFAGQPPSPFQADAFGKLPLSKIYNSPAMLPCGNNWANSGAGTTINQIGETDRLTYQCSGPVSVLQLEYPSSYILAGVETPMPNIVFHRASLELGTSTAPRFFTGGGHGVYQAVDPNGTNAKTDPLYQFIPAATPFRIREETAVAWPPTATSATAVSGGALTASTTYYYKATCLIPTGLAYPNAYAESGPSTEISAATGASGTLAINATFTSNATTPLGCPQIKIYRGTSTGSESFLALVTTNFPVGVASALVYNDTGALATTGIAAPSAQRYPETEQLHTGDYSNSSTVSGTPAFSAGVTGTSGMIAGPANAQTTGDGIAGPAVVFANNTSASPVCLLADSRGFGLGVSPGSSALNLGNNFGNWFNYGIASLNLDTINAGISGSRMGDFMGQGTFASSDRASMLVGCKYVVIELAINDLDASIAWTTVANQVNQAAQIFTMQGARVYVTTSEPAGTATDMGVLVANFTPFASDSARQNLNTWVRNGSQFSAGTAVTTGGTASPYILGYFDVAAAMGEVNSSGTPTLNGGYWPAGTLVGNGTVNGTPTTSNIPFSAITVSGVTVASHNLTPYVIKFTSGTDNGVVTGIADNSTTTLTVGFGNTLGSAPASGDTFNVYSTCTKEGLHQSLICNEQVGTGTNPFSTPNFATWAAAHFVNY